MIVLKLFLDPQKEYTGVIKPKRSSGFLNQQITKEIFLINKIF